MPNPGNIRALVSFSFITVGAVVIALGANRLPQSRMTDAPIASPVPITWALLENLESGFSLEYPSGSSISQEESGTLVTLASGEQIQIVAPLPTQVSITSVGTTEESLLLTEVISHMRSTVVTLDKDPDAAPVDLTRFVGASSEEQ